MRTTYSDLIVKITTPTRIHSHALAVYGQMNELSGPYMRVGLTALFKKYYWKKILENIDFTRGESRKAYKCVSRIESLFAHNRPNRKGIFYSLKFKLSRIKWNFLRYWLSKLIQRQEVATIKILYASINFYFYEYGI